MPERKKFSSFFQVVTQFNRDASNNVGWRFGGGAVDSVDPRFSLTESQLEFGFGFNYALSSSAMRRSLHEGTYECENEVGKATVQVLSVSDCQWSGWGGWGRCGTNCGTSESHSHFPIFAKLYSDTILLPNKRCPAPLPQFDPSPQRRQGLQRGRRDGHAGMQREVSKEE